jgi:hypothetical protein
MKIIRLSVMAATLVATVPIASAQSSTWNIDANHSHPPLLILDTPKQHELDTDNLRAFVNRFVEMEKKYKVDLQLVVAAKELEFLDPIDDTFVWRPFWGTGDDARFFGKYLPSEAGAYE